MPKGSTPRRVRFGYGNSIACAQVSHRKTPTSASFQVPLIVDDRPLFTGLLSSQQLRVDLILRVSGLMENGRYPSIPVDDGDLVTVDTWQGGDAEIGVVDSHDVTESALISMTASPPVAGNGDAGSASGVSINSLGVLLKGCRKSLVGGDLNLRMMQCNRHD
ncbi:hypothetical protein [Rhodoferax antarcticus]|uniref:hypothetical protein n=1 Tax=Rhodoferax antarcticus TaxID=81479 RepID=UPI0022243B58|nr:hypothetical protein [Rhodoferax antarcticus]MCW2311316.1 hypothetical protein [Rhodoferax antarcticus]